MKLPALNFSSSSCNFLSLKPKRFFSIIFSVTAARVFLSAREVKFLVDRK
jgi:hypothetical protein